MRICFISNMSAAPWGGSEYLWSAAAQRLKNEGHFVMASVKGWPKPATQISHMKANGVYVSERCNTPAKMSARLFAYLSRLIKLPHTRPSNSQIEWKKIKEFGPDLVCVSQGGADDGLEWMEFCLESNIPYVPIAQANSEWSYPTNETALRLAIAYQNALACCFVSQANLSLLEKQIGQRLINAYIVRNPFNVSYDSHVPWPNDSKELKLACVGRHSAEKGQDLILEALALPEWRNRCVKVSLYGAGRQAEAFKRLSRMLDVERAVVFAGHEPDITGIWAEHHMLILPSRREGLPLAIVEAMLCGRPVITTDTAGNAEVVEDGVTGFIAPAPKLQFVAEAMERAWQARPQLREMGIVAANQIRQIIPRDPVFNFVQLLLKVHRKTA